MVFFAKKMEETKTEKEITLQTFYLEKMAKFKFFTQKQCTKKGFLNLLTFNLLPVVIVFYFSTTCYCHEDLYLD